jgi:hypothetical protein
MLRAAAAERRAAAEKRKLSLLALLVLVQKYKD